VDFFDIFEGIRNGGKMEFASGEEFSLWLANAMTTFAGSKQPAPQEERNRAVNPTETPKERGRQ
jgi:hypothetical protein